MNLRETFAAGLGAAFLRNLESAAWQLYGGRPNAAEKVRDAVQDVCVRLLRALDPVTSVADLPSYWRRVLRHAWIDEFRSKRPAHRPLVDLMREEEPDAALDLAAALAGLRPDLRAVVDLLYFEGLSLCETAERLGVGRKVVARLRGLAIQHLRRRLDGAPTHLQAPTEP